MIILKFSFDHVACFLKNLLSWSFLIAKKIKSKLWNAPQDHLRSGCNKLLQSLCTFFASQVLPLPTRRLLSSAIQFPCLCSAWPFRKSYTSQPQLTTQFNDHLLVFQEKTQMSLPLCCLYDSPENRFSALLCPMPTFIRPPSSLATLIYLYVSTYSTGLPEHTMCLTSLHVLTI